MVWMNPVVARWMLLLNVRNPRPIKPLLVQLYQSEMGSGGWDALNPTHQGLAFDDLGHLTDGQHRLMAIIGSGFEGWFMVTFGVAASAVIDVGRTRTLGDAVRLSTSCVEADVAADVAAIVSIIADSSGRQRASKRERVEIYKRIRVNVDFAVELKREVGGRPQLGRAPIWAAVAVADLAGVARGTLRSFARIMGDGQRTDNDGSVSVMRLRDRVLTTTRSRISAREEFLLAQRVIKALASGKQLTKFYVPEEAPYHVPLATFDQTENSASGPSPDSTPREQQ